MDEQNHLTEETTPVRIEDQDSKTLWQQTKESWYDKVTLSVKQLDLIVGVCWALIGVTVVLIALDALDIFHLFG